MGGKTLATMSMRDMEDMARRSMRKKGPASLMELRAAHMSDADNVSMTDDVVSRYFRSMFTTAPSKR